MNRALILSIGLIVLSASGLPAVAAPYGSNLVTNGTAEANKGSTTGAVIGAVKGFTRSGNFTVVTYGAGGGFPSLSSPGPAQRGLNFFAGGPNSARSSGRQVMDVSDHSLDIDAGRVRFDVSAFLGGFSAQNDNAVIRLSFLDKDGDLLGAKSLGPVTAANRSNQTGLLLRRTTGILPSHTDTVALNLVFTRAAGSYNDGYADNLSFVLTRTASLQSAVMAPVPEPASAALLALGGGVVAMVARRKSAGARTDGGSAGGRQG